MIKILVYDYPEEEGEFEAANDGVKWMAAMHDLDNYLRSKIKYGDGGPQDYHEIRGELHSILDNYNLDF